VIEDSARRKESKRAKSREKRKEKKAKERIQKEEELKRIKNLMKESIKKQLAKIQETSGAQGNALVSFHSLGSQHRVVSKLYRSKRIGIRGGLLGWRV